MLIPIVLLGIAVLILSVFCALLNKELRRMYGILDNIDADLDILDTEVERISANLPVPMFDVPLSTFVAEPETGEDGKQL